MPNLIRFVSLLLLGLLWLYKVLLSPWLAPACRFSPSCSEYMRQAITKYGPFRGFWMGIKRISRCHPWGKSGYDPVK